MLFLLRKRAGKTEILLQRRQNTGYADGMWDCGASGHVEAGESLKQTMIREAREELGIRIAYEDVKFAAFTHKNSNVPYYNFFFAVERYEGTPAVMEPEKCAGIRWFDIEALPEELLPDRREALGRFLAGEPYGESGW